MGFGSQRPEGGGEPYQITYAFAKSEYPRVESITWRNGDDGFGVSLIVENGRHIITKTTSGVYRGCFVYYIYERVATDKEKCSFSGISNIDAFKFSMA